MTDLKFLTLSAMMSDVAMELAHALVSPEVDRYIMTRVRDKMRSEHGYALDTPLEDADIEAARASLRDELERSISHKEKEAFSEGDVSLALDCEAARSAVARWSLLG